MVVKHLVLSGGGPSIFAIFGALREAEEQHLWKISDLESIYGCSSGAWLAVAISLLRIGLTFAELENYLVNRTWGSLLTSKVLDMQSAFNSKGLFDKTIIRNSILPLLHAAELSADITLKELCELANLNVVFYTVDTNTKPLTKLELNTQEYGEYKIYELLTMSMALPGLITPTFLNDKCLIDGGLMANYPFEECLTNNSAKVEEVLGFKIKWTSRDLRLNEQSNFVSFMAHLVKMMALHIDHSENTFRKNNRTIDCELPDVGGPSGWLDVFINNEIRTIFIDNGRQSTKQFIDSHQEKLSQIQQE